MSSGISTSLSMHVAQRLEMALSPQMIQSMELLQMPLMQLEQRIRQEQLENPTLEIEEIENLHGETATDSLSPDPDPVDREEGGGPATEREYDEEANPDTDVYPDRDSAQGLDRVDEVDFTWDDLYDNAAPSRARSPDEDDVFDPIANAPARKPSLVEYLQKQLRETPMPDRTRRLAMGIIEKLDANGWITLPLAETVPEGELPPTAEELEAALAEVQKLDPDGIGARDLTECLLLQLANRPENNPIAEAMTRRAQLEDLAANRLPKIAKDLKCELEEVKRGAEIIRSLNPRPGAEYAEEPVLAVRPELIVEGDAESGFSVRLASGAQPQVSDFFTALFDNSRRGKIVRERLETDPEQSAAFSQFREQMRRTGLSKKFREKYNNAQWLVKAVAQREKTILAVASEIVAAQEEYLAERQSAPSPLFMQDIADKVGYDISTVSRAVKDKYIDTPLGIKQLKHFFARASGAAKEGADVSSNAGVLGLIREMIEKEDRRRPLRDNEIMERLAASGIVMKRRSIVNYREKLGYPSHSHRREH